MAYELQVQGQPRARYETSDEAEARARAILQIDADCVIEIIDLSTGRPYAPAASRADRNALAQKIGF